jgi:hypothetical protein
MYAHVCSADIRGKTTKRTLCKSYSGPTPKVLDVRSFLKTLWIIRECTRHSLDHCARTSGRTLGLLDVRKSDRELVADFPYK